MREEMGLDPPLVTRGPALVANLEPPRKSLGPDLLLGKRLGPNTSPPIWSRVAMARRRRGAAIVGARRGHPARHCLLQRRGRWGASGRG